MSDSRYSRMPLIKMQDLLKSQTRMAFTLDKEDLLTLVKGTGGPGTYQHPFNSYGHLMGFPNEHWQWDEDRLKLLSEHQLWELYMDLKRWKANGTKER